jgi:hypothetical protein
MEARCRQCGQVGESSDNPLVTLDCDHTFHEICILDRVCPICSTNVDCAICLEPIDDQVEPLTGCVHRFHPTCIIDYLRRSDTQGKCPLCRRNPFEQENEQEDDEFRWIQGDDSDNEEENMREDEAWRATQKVRDLQIKTAINEARKRKPRKEIESMRSRLKKARDTHAKSVKLRKQFLESRQYSKMKSDLKRLRREASDQAKLSRQKRSLLRQKQREIRKNTPSSKSWSSKRRMESIKSEVGSKVDPLWQYWDDETGSWSERMSSSDIRKKYKEGIIQLHTLIRHPEFPSDMEFRYVRFSFEYKQV